MAYTTLQDLYSKKPCPICEEHKLTTNSTAKVDAIMRYRCLNCGNEFSEDEDERRNSDRGVSRKTAQESSLGSGAIVLMLMVATILAILLYGEEDRQRDDLQPLSQVELQAQPVS